MPRIISQKPLSEKWMKAAVVGSLWAFVEIVPGSLLHNLKVPMAGSILSVMTVYLVISFYQVWKLDGMIWRAGLICALMKSISPSAIILGPMLGILSEALILEMVIRLMGRNNISYSVAGALAVFSALAQKALTLLVLYGWDFVVLLENMYDFAARQLRMEGLKASVLLLILSAIYLLAGMMAGLLGARAGKSFLKQQQTSSSSFIGRGHVKSDLFRHFEKKNHSVMVLILIFLLLVGGMWLIANGPMLLSGVFILGFVSFMFIRYKKNMGYLRKPALWVQLALILLFSMVFHHEFVMRLPLPSEGLEAGTKMIFRALLLLSAFSGISSELKNPLVKNILYNRGMENLYRALELTFSALPGIMHAFSGLPTKIKGMGYFTRRLLESSQSLLDHFYDMEQSRPPVFVITGKINEGKTALAAEIVRLLKDQRLQIHGVLSRGNADNASRNAYFARDINSGKQELLCSDQPIGKEKQTSRFYFSETGITMGRQAIIHSIEANADLVVIDELGPMEINDLGWAPAVSYLMDNSKLPHLWVVREHLVKIMLRKWNVGKVLIFDLNHYQAADIIPYLLEAIREYSSDSAPSATGSCPEETADREIARL